jgi:hypothetical protein
MTLKSERERQAEPKKPVKGIWIWPRRLQKKSIDESKKTFFLKQMNRIPV